MTESPDPYQAPKPLESYEFTQEDLDKLRDETKKRMSGHAWRQQGTQVFCTSCPFNHGFSVPPGMFLVGIDKDGNPEMVNERG